jgi:formylmethanofuran dehydrogenase subunit E
MKRVCLCIIVLGILSLGIVAVWAYQDDHVTTDHHSDGSVRSTGGENPWNQGQPPEDWWGEIKRTHGHVGPWNVLGWRVGQAALREFDVKWGRHDLDIICYIPMQMPYSCMADGLVIGTGNCIGRLDIRLAEVMSIDLIHVAVRRKDDTGPILIFRPSSEYLRQIEKRQVHELEKLSQKCMQMKETDLFQIERLVQLKASG